MEPDTTLLPGSEATLSPACTPTPAYHPTFILALTVCVNFFCVLSIIGASLIIGTFVAFKSLRTRARQILVQLSIADFMVATSHLVGIDVNLPKLVGTICVENPNTDLNFTTDTFCSIQGGVTIFFSMASFLWTIAVALYLLVIITFESQRAGKWVTWLSYPVCWGVPTLVIIAYALRSAFGFHANVDTGWCYLQDQNHYHNDSNVTSGYHVTIPEVFSQVFVYFTFFTLILLYIWIRCSIRFKIRRVSNKVSITYKLRLKAKNADLKLTFIPIIFVFLHMWTTGLGIAYIYLPQSKWEHFRGTRANAALVMLAAIGSSSQGLMNALLFCVFTSVVRKRLLNLLKKCLCCTCCKRDGPRTYLLEPSSEFNGSARENTTLFDDEAEIWKSLESKSPSCQVTGSYTGRLFSESLEGSKYHTISVGKTATKGTE